MNKEKEKNGIKRKENLDNHTIQDSHDSKSHQQSLVLFSCLIFQNTICKKRRQNK